MLKCLCRFFCRKPDATPLPISPSVQHDVRNAIQGWVYERRNILCAVSRIDDHVKRIEAAVSNGDGGG
jgi:hypothetical protein